MSIDLYRLPLARSFKIIRLPKALKAHADHLGPKKYQTQIPERKKWKIEMTASVQENTQEVENVRFFKIWTRQNKVRIFGKYQSRDTPM